MASKRAIWVAVAGGLETLSGLGARVWSEPPAVRNALRELLSVLPITQVQIDCSALLGRQDPPADWASLLNRSGEWRELLAETAAATEDAVRGRAEWGLGLPSPQAVSAAAADRSERATLKAGLLLASFLQGFRAAGLAFVAVDLCAGDAPEKAVAPIFRNAALYGWKRAALVRDSAQPACGADIRLVARDDVSEAVWRGEEPAGLPEADATLFLQIPRRIEPAAIVAAGQALCSWRGER
jgi:hypothetical protein